MDALVRNNIAAFIHLSVALLATAAPAHAQRYYGYHPRNGYGNHAEYGEFDPERASWLRKTHGILAALAMIILFPSGSVLMRVIPSPFALYVHGMTQLVAFVLFTVAVAMGFALVREVGKAGIHLWDRDNTNYHLIIGLVVLICLTAQPALGAIHHAKFKKLRRRQVWSYLHLFNGRIFITLGIIDGALGLWIARESSTWKMVYLASAGVIWSLWMAVAIWSEWRRRRGRRRENRLQRRAMGSKFNDWDVVIRN